MTATAADILKCVDDVKKLGEFYLLKSLERCQEAGLELPLALINAQTCIDYLMHDECQATGDLKLAGALIEMSEIRIKRYRKLIEEHKKDAK